MRYYRTGLFGAARLCAEKSAYWPSALIAIPHSEVCTSYPACRIRLVFPLWATQLRRSLPHVVGSPASEYYGAI